MPRLTEIREVVGDIQDLLSLNQLDEIGSWCNCSFEIAKQLKGWVYLTEQHSNFGLEHRVAVIKQRGSASGLVIDITQKNPFIGNVTSVKEPELVSQELAQLLGVKGWKVFIDYSNK